MKTSTTRPAAPSAPRALLLALLAGCGSTMEPGAQDMAPPTPSDAAPFTRRPDLGDSELAVLRLTVSDGETGLYLPSRVIVTAVPPTPAVAFDVTREGVSANGEFGVKLGPGVVGAPEGVLLEAGAGTVHVPPGIYDLFITHGPEWEADQRRVTVGARQTVPVDAVLDRTVDTRGWMATDLHVHTRRSFDSKLPEQDRVLSLVSVGIEMLVATDHNVLTDLHDGRGGIVDHGYETLARGYVGDEFNFDPGHGGAYPMPYIEQGVDGGGRSDGGATLLKLNWEVARELTISQMYDALGQLPTRPAVTVNHPRLGDLGYFDNLTSPRYGKGYGAVGCTGAPRQDCGWAPPALLGDAGRFDALEIMNGYQQGPDGLRVVLRDWFFLLSGGTRVTGLGSSDTHRLRDVKAGFPRTWLRMGTDDPLELDPQGAGLADAIRKGRAVASNGPFLSLRVQGADIGDMVRVNGNTATVDLTIDAPAWIDLDTARVFVNGRVAKELPVADSKTRPRLVAHIDALPLPAGDCWIAVQVGGAKPLPTALIGEHERGAVMPFAITNPVFVDVDGDGRFDPRLPPVDADPGPLGPLNLRGDVPLLDTGDHNRHWREDCEPPLWVDPSTWVNP